MAWSPDDAPSHTKKASTERLKKLWAEVANSALEMYGGNEERAIRAANAAVDRAKRHYI